MNLYTNKKRWKWVLAIVAVLIVGASLWYTNNLVRSVTRQEINQVKMWAAAMEQHAVMMKSTEEFFAKVSEQEQMRVDLLAQADDKVNIMFSNNLPEGQKEKKTFDIEMKRAYSKFEPIKINPGYGQIQYLYYNESMIYTELKAVLEEMIEHFLSEITLNSVGAPVIITDATGTKVLSYGNMDSTMMQNPDYVTRQINIMASENDPLEINFMNTGKAKIYYRTSDLIEQMRYFPILQFVVIALYLLIAYLLFSWARRSEQNQVWAGMAKETAHQLGTPISSLMGWVELLRMQEEPFAGTEEMQKDIERLQIVTDRFSKIGSVPSLEPTDIIPVIKDTMDYLQKRFSKKFEFDIQLPCESLVIPLVPSLFRWVLENLTKNAVDAMGDHGKLTLELVEGSDEVIIDLSDTGKGIPKSKQKQVFNPGYTSKKRGWGLGLSLAKRIVEEYHKGKIFVKSSVLGQGTTFRIILKKS